MIDISIERMDELFEMWGSETIFPESEEWREDLSEEEARIVAIWDKGFHLGVQRLGNAILAIGDVQAKSLQPELS